MTQKMARSFAELTAATVSVSENEPVVADTIGSNAPIVLDLKELVMDIVPEDDGAIRPEWRILTDEAVDFLLSDEMATEFRRKANTAAARIKLMQANPANEYAGLIAEPDMADDFASRVKIVVMTAMRYGFVSVPKRWSVVEKLRGKSGDFWKRKYHESVKETMTEFFGSLVPFRSRGFNASDAKAMRDGCDRDAAKLADVEEKIASSQRECTLQRAIGRLNSSMWLAETHPRRKGTKYLAAVLLPEGYEQGTEMRDLYEVFRDFAPLIDDAIAESGLTRAERDVVDGVRLGMSYDEIAEIRGCTVDTVYNQKKTGFDKITRWFADGTRRSCGDKAPAYDRLSFVLDIEDDEIRMEALAAILQQGKQITRDIKGINPEVSVRLHSKPSTNPLIDMR